MTAMAQETVSSTKQYDAAHLQRREALRFDPIVAEILEMDGAPKIIGDIAEKFGVTFRALRHYEVKGLLSPVMTAKGRVYGKKDQIRLRLLLEGKKWGLELKVIKQILDLYDPRRGCIEQVRCALGALKEQETRLEAERAKIDHQIGLLKKALKDGPEAIVSVQGA